MTAGAAPVVDALLLNPLAVPPGVGAWLRGWERTLRATLVEVDRAPAPRRPVPAWDDAVAELRGVDPAAPDSVFRLLLLRPLWQLDEGTAARETFERYAQTVLERLASAKALVREIEPLLSEREYLIDEYGTRFPNRLREQLTRVRARDEDLVRLRRASDAARMRTRIARAGRALAQISAILDADPRQSFEVIEGSVVPGEAETLAELVVALALAQRVRRQLEVHTIALREHRGHLVAQLRGLALSAPQRARDGRTRAAGHLPIVLERLIHAAAAFEGRSLEGRDAPLWTGAVSAALAAHHPGLDRFAWTPALLAAETPAQRGERTVPGETGLLHAVPMGDGLVYLSPLPESAIRVRTRSFRPGDPVECQVAPDMVARHAAALVDADVGAMFDGLDARRSRWYTTASRAVVTVVARCGAGWFARIDRRGALAVSDQPAWHADAPGSAFRLLHPARRSSSRFAPADDPADSDVVAPAQEGALSTFMGFRLREVRTGLLGDERAWARALTGDWAGGTSAIRREADLFARLEAYQAEHGGRRDLALRPLTWARTIEEQGMHPLYRIPIATLDAPSRLRAWITESDQNLLTIVGAVARIVTAAHAAGFALGICHSEAFAYALDWSAHPLTPRPDAILAHAPGATRLGEPFAPPVPANPSPAYYTMLRTPIILPQVAAAQIATPERDMAGFGAFVLDLLLERPIFERGSLDWYDAPAVVRARASQCSAHPTVAKQLGDLIPDPLGWRRLGDMTVRIAAGKVRKVAELL